jgi:hypothetical protein
MLDFGRVGRAPWVALQSYQKLEGLLLPCHRDRGHIPNIVVFRRRPFHLNRANVGSLNLRPIL